MSQLYITKQRYNEKCVILVHDAKFGVFSGGDLHEGAKSTRDKSCKFLTMNLQTPKMLRKKNIKVQ